MDSCQKCQARKEGRTHRVGELHPLEQVDWPFQRIGIDTVGPLRSSAAGNRKVLVIIDHKTRFAIAVAVANESAETVAHVLITHVLTKFSAPEVILSDRGKNFRTELLREMHRQLQLQHVTSSANHPQTNGLTERFDRTLSTMLSMYISKHHRDWDEYLPFVVHAYNSTVQDSLNSTPFYLLHGFHPRLPSDIMGINPRFNCGERLQHLQLAREAAAVALAEAQRTQKEQYDRGRHKRQFEIGDKVWMAWLQGRRGQSTRFRGRYIGPCEVTSRHRDTYWVKHLERRANRPEVEAVHVSRLKRYEGRTTPRTSER